MISPTKVRLYSYWRSSASYRVRIALNLKGVRPDYVAVNLAAAGGGEQNQPAYRAVNPQGRVPSLEVNGHVLTQSMAILEYLEETHPAPALLPADAFGRARVRALAGIVACDIQPLQNLVVTQYLRGRGFDDAAVKAWLREWIGRGLVALEAGLARDGATGRFCHGDRPGLADVCLVPQCYAAARFGIALAAYPVIARIDAACRELDAFRQAAPEAQPDAPV